MWGRVASALSVEFALLIGIGTVALEVALLGWVMCKESISVLYSAIGAISALALALLR